MVFQVDAVKPYNKTHPRREPGGPGVAAPPLLNLGAASVWLLPCNRTEEHISRQPSPSLAQSVTLCAARSVRHRCWSGNGPLPDLAAVDDSPDLGHWGAPCLYITRHYANRPRIRGLQAVTCKADYLHSMPLPLPSIQRQQQKTF